MPLPLPASPHLTVVVTAHSEGRLLRPTLRSVSAALANLADGDTAELLIVCDNSDERTLHEARHWRDADDLTFAVRMELVSVGESGAARNAGAAAAAGEFVAFVDGDDLVSANYFSTALSRLRSAETPTIVHPQYIVSFGARTLLWKAVSTLTHDITYRDLVRHNLWPSSAVTRRSVYLDHPYRSLPPSAGYGPEDWIWNIDTTAAGVTHDVAVDTAFFYRVRERGGVNNRHGVSILPAFDLDGLRKNLPLPDPSNAKRKHSLHDIGARLYKVAQPLARKATDWLSHDVRRGIYRSGRWVLRTLTGRGAHHVSWVPTPPAIRDALHAAAEIEPAISWTAYDFEELPTWSTNDDGYTEIIENALDGLAGENGAIVAVPWVGVGGADLVSLNYAAALEATDRYAGRTTMLGTYLSERTLPHLLPEGVKYVHLDKRWLTFSPRIRKRLLAQIMVLARPELVVSVNCFHLIEAMQVHASQIMDGTNVYATLFAFDRIGSGFPTNPITDDSQREYLDDIGGIITDNTTTASLIEDILALPPERVLVHRQPALAEPKVAITSTAAYVQTDFSTDKPFRLLWPHRLDDEKQPGALVAIANELTRRRVPAVIEVWGQRVLTNAGDSLMRDLKRAGVVYRGPYSGGLASLDLAAYHSMLLTSKSEGLPLVLVQSLQMGLPVIASSVGGVPDIIIDGQTGLLTAGPTDAAGFADAIERLMGDIELRRALIDQGRAFALERHSRETFQNTVEQSFSI